jgi:hypothetical protein
MKKGDKVKIYENAKYSGQNMKWTEACTGTKILQVGEIYYHASSVKISTFHTKETCFADKKYTEGFYYALRVLSPLSVEMYDQDEIRIDLEKHAKDVEIFYIGTITGRNTGQVHPKGSQYGMERIRKDNTLRRFL